MGRRREAAVPLALAAATFVLAFAQRPGWASSDTKIHLHLEPGRFLADVASLWTSTGDLGHIHSGQHTGYLFPMGPFFAAGHGLGLPEWVVQRLWLGTLLALGAWGVVRLLDALLGRPRGMAHLVAGGLAVVNPFVVTYANRTTVTLLATAVLPWLLLAVHRGVHDPRGWRWPAAVALLVTASGGGINGAVTVWMLLGPLLLLVYEAAVTPVGWRAARAFALRAVPATAVVSLWWIVPTYVQSSHGIDFLRFTEQPGTIWGTTSVPESLRLMGFWLSYVGIGFAGRAIPYFDTSETMLFSAPVVLATLLVPALALTGFVWTRRWRYGPFFLGLALIALLVMAAGFPEGTPLRSGLTFTYYHLPAVQFLRGSYKAGPLLALALACLAGAAAGEAWRRLGWTSSPALRQGALALAVTGLVVVAAWPLVAGRAQDAQVSWKRIPAAWTAAARGLDRELPAGSRAVVLPGDLFAFYRWGGTVDPILPALSRRPVAERNIVPYADLRATDLLWTIDALVHQHRLVPGQLPPLLSLVGARAVVSGSDDDLHRSGAPPAADAARELASQLPRPTRGYGPVRPVPPSSDGLGAPVALPQVRRFDLPAARGLVRVQPESRPLIVDGSAAGVAALAAFDALPVGRTLLYAADLSRPDVRRMAAQGADVVVSDSNRRRAFVGARIEQNTGPTLAAEQDVSADGLVFDPFGRGASAQTVAVLRGARSLEAPYSPGRPQFPEHRPFAAFDRSAATAWLADPTLDRDAHWLEVRFRSAREVPYVDLLPYGDREGAVREVEIAGRRFRVHPRWNRLRLDLRQVGRLRLRLSAVTAGRGAGGIRELRVPGLRVSEQLRLPRVAEAALGARELRRAQLTYLFERTTGDDPYRRNLVHGPWSALHVRDRGDPERTMRRVFQLAAPRSFAAEAWVSVSPRAPDHALDRLMGYRGRLRATSSSRFLGRPAWRASRALDGDRGTAWLGGYVRGQPAWLGWRTRRATTVRGLRLVPPSARVRRPALVRLRWPGGASPPLPVAGGGRVTLPRPVRARAFRLEVVRTALPPAASPAERHRRAVGIAEVRGVSGLPPGPSVRSMGAAARCGAVRVRAGARTLRLRVEAGRAALEAGRPLRARGCEGPVRLSGGTQELAVSPGLFAVEALRLTSPAPVAPPPAAASGRVIDPGRPGRGRVDAVRLAVHAPSWLVLGESYNRGWRAWCDGRPLGAPTPIDGYANGWRIGPGCRAVRFAFAPNGMARAGYALSALAGLACLVLLLAARRRRPAVETQAAATPPAAGDSPPAWPAPRAALAGVLGGAAFGFVFGIPAGALAAPALALVLWRGVGARALTLGAGALLGVVVPLLYLVEPGNRSGGDHSGFPTDHIEAHWVGVAAVGLLLTALWRALSAARGRPESSTAVG